MSIVGKALWPLGLKKSYTVVLYGWASKKITVDGTDVALDSSGNATVTLTDGEHVFVDGYISNNTKTLTVSGDCSVVMCHNSGTIGQFSTGAVHNVNGGTQSGNRTISWEIPSDNIAPITKVYVAGAVRCRQTCSSNVQFPGTRCQGWIYVNGSSSATASRTKTSGYDLSNNGWGTKSGSQYVRNSSWYSMSGTATVSMTIGTVSINETIQVYEGGGLLAPYAYADGYTASGYCY